MSNVFTNHTLNQPTRYELRVVGHLGVTWAHWFEGLVISPKDDGTTILSGELADQSALHGLLKKIRDLGMPLISVNPLPQADKSAKHL